MPGGAGREDYTPMPTGGSGAKYSGNGSKSGTGNGQHLKTKTTFTSKKKATDDIKATAQGTKSTFIPSPIYHAWKGVKKWSDAQNLEKRTKFAQDEGLAQDWARTHQGLRQTKSHHGLRGTGSTLDVMSDQGKDYLKEAGYGPFQDKSTGGGDGTGQQQTCPDGSMPPCPPTATVAPTATTTTPTNTGWQFYPTNSNYLTGEGYDRGGGVKFGPPPKKGPNPQVPPVKFSRGGGCAIRGTKFSGVK